MRIKSIILLGSVCVFLLVGWFTYRFATTGKFFAADEKTVTEEEFVKMYEEDTKEIYNLSDLEKQEFADFYQPLLEKYMRGDIVKEEYELELSRYYVDLDPPQDNQELKERKVEALKVHEGLIAIAYNNSHVTPLLVDIALREPFYVTEEEKGIIERSGVHPYDINTYIQSTVTLLNNKEPGSCNVIETLKSHNVQFASNGISIAGSDLSIKSISTDPCLMWASTVILGEGILRSIENSEAYQYGDYVIIYDRPKYDTVGTPTVIPVTTWESRIKKITENIVRESNEYLKTLEEIRPRGLNPKSHWKTWNKFARGFYQKFFRKSDDPTLSDAYAERFRILWNYIEEQREFYTSLGAPSDAIKVLDDHKKMLLKNEKLTLEKVEGTINLVELTAYAASTALLIYGSSAVLAGSSATATVTNAQKASSIFKSLKGAKGVATLKASLSMIKITFAFDCVISPILKAGFNSVTMNSSFLHELIQYEREGFSKFWRHAPFAALLPIGVNLFATAVGLGSAGTVLAGSKTVQWLSTHGLPVLSKIPTLATTSGAWVLGNYSAHMVASTYFFIGMSTSATSGLKSAYDQYVRAVNAESNYLATGNEKYYAEAEVGYKNFSSTLAETIQTAYFLGSMAIGSLKQAKSFLQNKQRSAAIKKENIRVTSDFKNSGDTITVKSDIYSPEPSVTERVSVFSKIQDRYYELCN